MMRIGRGLIILALLVAVAFPIAVSAQGPTQADQAGGTFGGLFPIVTCGSIESKTACTPCGFLDILENIVKFVTFGVTGPVAALLFIYAGVLFLISAGNVQRIQTARKVLTNTVYGVAIILLAWLVVVQLIKIVAPGSNADRWYEFDCPESLREVGGTVDDPAPVVVGPGEGAMHQLPLADCEDFAGFAAITGGNPDPRAESDALLRAKACLLSDPLVKALYDPRPHQFSSYENEPLWCNPAKGDDTACADGSGDYCEHGHNSCHFGGQFGSDGAEAVDFNYNNKSVLYNIVTRQATAYDTAAQAEAALQELKAEANDKGDEEALRQIKAEWRITGGEKPLLKALIYASKTACVQAGVKIKQIHLEHPDQVGAHTHVSVFECDGDDPINPNYDPKTKEFPKTN